MLPMTLLLIKEAAAWRRGANRGQLRRSARGVGWCWRCAAAWQRRWRCALLIIIQGKQRLHKNEKCKMMMICFATRHSKTTWSGLSEPWGRGITYWKMVLLFNRNKLFFGWTHSYNNETTIPRYSFMLYYAFKLAVAIAFLQENSKS